LARCRTRVAGAMRWRCLNFSIPSGWEAGKPVARRPDCGGRGLVVALAATSVRGGLLLECAACGHI
jgi:hypothetical protein